MREVAALTLALAFIGVAPGRALLLVLGPAELERALTLARHPEAERAAFHKRYLVQTGDPTVQEVGSVTEFRRVLLAAEDHIRRGDHMFTPRQATTELAEWRGKVTIVLRLVFHPQNVLVRVPEYTVTLDGAAVPALDVRRTPVYALATPKQGTAIPLYGGLVETDFDSALVGQFKRQAVVSLEGKEITRATIDFSALE